MAGQNGQEMLETYVPAGLGVQFKMWAHGTDSGASAALRRLIFEAVDGRAPPKQRASASGHQVLVRLRDGESVGLLQGAKTRSTTPTNWLPSLAIIHLRHRSQWNGDEAAALRSAQLPSES